VIPRRALLVAALAAALPLAGGGGAPAYAEPPADPTEALLASASASVVPVRGVLKISFAMGGQSGEQEQAATIRGTILDGSGLVAVPDVVGTLTAVFKRILPEGATLTIVPSRIRVLLGDDQKEFDAVDVVRDTQAGIAWVQVLEPPAGMKSLDLAGATSLRLGQRLTVVGRMSRQFDFAPEMRRVYVTRRVERPRAMWGLSDGNPGLEPLGGAGLPAFDAGGRIAGLLVARIAEGERLDFAALLASGGDHDVGGTFVLSLEEARASLASAKKRVPEALEKAKSAPKEPEKKEGGDAPAGMDGDTKAPPAPGMDGDSKAPPAPGMDGQPKEPPAPGMGR